MIVLDRCFISNFSYIYFRKNSKIFCKIISRLTGYITTTESKYSTRLLVNYKFEKSKEELIDFESEVEGLHDGVRTSLVGMAKWNTTAYKKYNFKASIDYKRVLGHIELGLNINNAVDFIDPKYDLGIRVTLIKTEPEDKESNSKTNFAIEVTRPISKINYKFMIKYVCFKQHNSNSNVADGIQVFFLIINYSDLG